MQQFVYLWRLIWSPAQWCTVGNAEEFRVDLLENVPMLEEWKEGQKLIMALEECSPCVRHCAQPVRYSYLITSTEVGSILVLLLQTRKWRFRRGEVKYLAWGHTAEPRFKPRPHDPVLGKLLIVAALESEGQRLIAQRVVPTYKNVRKGMALQAKSEG